MLGWQGVRALMDALRAVNYQHAKSIRLWKSGCEDEGTRAVCLYLKANLNVQVLELLDNGITKLGCEFLSGCLAPSVRSQLIHLKLDHNSFGSEGVRELADGLS